MDPFTGLVIGEEGQRDQDPIAKDMGALLPRYKGQTVQRTREEVGCLARAICTDTENPQEQLKRLTQLFIETSGDAKEEVNRVISSIFGSSIRLVDNSEITK